MFRFRKRCRHRAALAVLLMSFSSFLSDPSAGDEGKWTPEQLLQFRAEQFRKLGLRIRPDKLWGSSRSLLRATVIANGCSGAFISPQGLVVTNYHCVLDILQKHSTPTVDLVSNGYQATGRKQELPSDATVRVFDSSQDVTAQISRVLLQAPDDRTRFHAFQTEASRLASECGRRQNHKCRVVTYDGGGRFVLVDELEFSDVRLVFSPPSSVADFGGDLDNWNWPRHAGDVALLRVYAGADNLPAAPALSNHEFNPPAFFRINSDGTGPNQPVMIVGYPNQTFRNITPEELQERQRWLALRADLYKAWIEIFERGSRDAAVRRALAARFDRISNEQKSSRGQAENFIKFRLLKKAETAASEVMAWAKHRSNFSNLGRARQMIAEIVARRQPHLPGDLLLSEIHNGPMTLARAIEIVQRARIPNALTCPGNRSPCPDPVKPRMQLDGHQMDSPTEQALLAELLERLTSVAALRPALEAFLGRDASRESIERTVRAAHQASKIGDLQEQAKMLGETTDQLRARHDPLLDLAFALQPAFNEAKDRKERDEGAMLQLRPFWTAAVIAHGRGRISSDANATLRVAFGHVRGYMARDAVWLQPQTTLKGLLERYTGKGPTNLPEKFLTAAKSSGNSRWIDRQLHTVPVNFLADLDTSGGNSGSAVVNGKGELVGINFDRTWESVANDLAYNHQSTRNISLDVRYLLWLLDTYWRGYAGVRDELMGPCRGKDRQGACDGKYRLVE